MTTLLRTYAIPLAIFFLCLGVTVATWVAVKDDLADQRRQEFTEQTQKVASLVQSRMMLYTDALYGLQGLFMSSDDVTEDEWDSYAQTLNLPKNYAGISALLYMERIPHDASSSFPYAIYPVTATSTGDYYPITYVSSVTATSSRNAYGFDASSDPVRYEAMLRSAETDAPAASGAVTSVATGVPVFSIYAPLYAPGTTPATLDLRKNSVEGYVAATFRIENLFEGIASDPIFNPDINLEIYDGPPERVSSSTLLYDTTPPDLESLVEKSSLTSAIPVTVGGRTWTLYFLAMPEYGAGSIAQYVPYAVLVIGFALSLLISLLIYSFARSRARAIALANRITRDLAQSQALFRLSVDNAGDMLFLCDEAGKVVETNKRATELLGYTRDELLRLSISDFDVQENGKPYLVPFQDLQKGEIVRMEGEIRRKDTSYLDIEATLSLFEESQRKFVLALVRDVTERKAAEEIVEEQHAKDEAILSSISDGLVVTDVSGAIISVNKAFEETLGYEAREVVGKRLTDVVAMTNEKGEPVAEEDRLIVRALKKKSLQATSGISSVYYARKDGGRFPAFIAVTPIYIGSMLLGAVEVFRDVTHEKEIDKAKTEFVSLASHQLRTPLSAIGWYAELLLGGDAGKLTKNQKEFVDQIMSSNKRMVDLVNALLNVSRIDLGTLAVDPKPLDAVQTAESVLGELAPQVAERRVAVVKEYQAPQMPFIADPNLMRILFQNLLSNAIKYTPPEGKVTLSVSTDAEWLHITVADTGYGIPKTQQGKIFTKLFRADNAREKDPDGNGLGLYLVKAIVEENGGKVWFESQENQGTTFFIMLPASGMKRIEGSKTLTQ